MAYRYFLILLLIDADCLSFSQSRRVVEDYDQFGYIVKSVKHESDNTKSAATTEERNLEFPNGRLPKVDLTGKVSVASLDPRHRSVEEFSVERVKNDSALPLHVTSTARQECLEGYVADENGICQKTIAGKGKKSFKLMRRRRGEQVQPKLSYADVVKFGKNRPSTVPFKAEILTTTPRLMEIKTDRSSVLTTIKLAPTEAVGVTTPSTVDQKATTLPQKKVPDTTPASATPKEPLGKIGESVVTTLPAIKPTSKGAETTTSPGASGASIKKPEATSISSPDKPTTSRPSGHIIPKIITGIPSRVKSVLGDLNDAFLSSEKQSISAQNSGANFRGTHSDKKSPDVTRLRRGT